MRIASKIRHLSESKRVFFLAGIFFILCMILIGRPYIGSDGGAYFALTDSLANDFDFTMENQKYLIEVVGYAVQYNPVVGKFVSPYAAGTAFLNMPFVWLASRVNEVFPLFPEYEAYFHIPFLKALGVLTASTFYGFMTMIMMWYAARRYFRRNCLFECMALFVSFPTFYYTFLDPSFAHAADTFVVTALLWAFSYRDRLTWKQHDVSFMILGFLAGLMVVIRNVNVVLIIPYVLFFLRELYRKRLTAWRFGKATIQAVIGILPFVVFSLWYNKNFYGSVASTAYFGAGVLDSTPHYFWHYYLHPIRGVVFWAPVSVLSLAGLYHLRKKPEAFFITISAIVSAGIALGFYNKWWAGITFGQRYMTMLYPFFVLGLCAFLDAYRKRAWKILTIACVVYVIMLMHVHLITVNTRAGNNVLLTETYTPVDLTRAAITAYREEATAAEKNPLVFLYDRVYGGINPTLFYAAQKLLAGTGPAIIQSSEVMITGQDSFEVKINVFSLGNQREVSLGVDLWDAKRQAHSDTHYFWSNSKPVKLSRGDHQITIDCTLRGFCAYHEGNAAYPSGEYWVNPQEEELIAQRRIIAVHAVLYDEGGTVDVDGTEMYFRSHPTSDISLCDAYPDLPGERCVWDSVRWREETPGLYSVFHDGENPSILAVNIPKHDSDANNDQIADVPLTFRIRVKVDHNSSGRGLFFTRWNAAGDVIQLFPSDGARGGETREEVLSTDGTFIWSETVLPAGDTRLYDAPSGKGTVALLGIGTYNDGDRVLVDDVDVVY